MHAPIVPLDFLSGGGEMGALMRAMDWTRSPLGLPADWPRSLKTCVRIILTSSQPMFVWWGEELINLYNDAYRAIVGGKHPKALGQPAATVWREIWDQAGPRAAYAMQHNEGTYDEALLLIMERHGYREETYYTFSYSPVPDDNGGIGGIICANTDDTQRIIGERQLALLRELATGTSDARSVEEACRLGVRALETNLRDLPFALIYLVDAERQRAVLAGASGIMPGTAGAPEEIPLDGSAIWPLAEALGSGEARLLDLAARPLDLPRGAWDRPPRYAALQSIASQGQTGQTGVLVAGLNPYRLFDADYQRLLDLVAGQLAAAIANAQAYQQERRRAEALAEIDRAKTVFFSNASHEFRTPLTLLLSPLEDILARYPTAETVLADRRELELMHRNGLRLLKLVNTMLDFSRIEAGRVQASYEPIDLGAYTAELASTFRSAMQRAGLRFTVDCAPLAVPVHVDRDMWEKIVLNLVSNAFKYTLDGEVEVSLRASEDGRGVELSVRDSGVGIPEHELPRIFERFHRIEGQRGRTQEGTGIGLALVHELVRLHGGSVQVESAVGSGTCFRIFIPIGTDHLPAERVQAERRLSPTPISAEAFVEEALRWLPGDWTAVSSLHEIEPLEGPLADTVPAAERPLVLLADDNADMRDYVSRLLSRRYRVLAVADGQAALEAAKRECPDLVLSDVMMPQLDGFGLLRALRLDSGLRDAPVILLSARAGEEAKVEGLESGADDYLVKPFSARELIARVDANIALAQLRRRTEAELRQVNEMLEQRVAAEIAERMKVEEVLRHSQKMEAIGRLTGGIAHDFNNLLHVIINSLNGVLRRADSAGIPLPQDWRRLIGSAMRGAERAAVLTQQLLAFSRRQPLNPRPTNVNKLVSGMSDLLRRALGETIAIETVTAGGLWLVSVDANQLESAILNLAVNARDAMPGGGKLTIETANSYLDETYAATHDEVAAGQYVVISVSDTGMGMGKDIIDKAFDPFFTTKEIGQGTGLGLSQVYGFVKQSGGHVKIYSELGEGTSVKLYLPRLLTKTEAEEEGAVSTPIPRSQNGDIVLFVEDDDMVRAATGDMLRELGYGVAEAVDGEAALRLLREKPEISLLFTDVGLPGNLNGRQLADAARAIRPALPVLFTTGYARNAIVHHGRLDPGIELLVKPFTYVALAGKLRQILDRRN